MIRSRSYDDEFKREAVNLVRNSEKAITEIAKDLGIPESTLHGWLKKSSKDSGGRIVTDSEVTRLRKELADTKLERDILKKAVAIFSQK